MEGFFVVFSSFPNYFEFGTTELNSTFETAAVLLSPHCRVKLISVRHGSSATFGAGLSSSGYASQYKDGHKTDRFMRLDELSTVVRLGKLSLPKFVPSVRL